MPAQNLISSDSDGGLSGPIEVYYGNPALDLGMAAIPKMLARFWTFLASDGEQLNDQEYAVLIQVLSLRETQDYELRAENLPVRCSPSTRERYKARFRRLGLVFTERLFYPTGGRGNPVMRAQRWDLRSLFYNLEHVACVWLEHQKQLTVDWEAGGRKGQRPIFNLPGDFTHEVELPFDVAADILRGRFYPVPEKWQSRAEQLLSGLEPALLSHDHSWTAPDSPGSRTRQEKRGSAHRTAPNPTGSEDRTAHEPRGSASWSARIPRGHLKGAGEGGGEEKLISQSADETQSAAPVPAAEATERYVVVDLYTKIIGTAPPIAVITRLTLAAAECHAYAQHFGETGWVWVARALVESAGRADDLLAYTLAVLKRWQSDGPDSDTRPRRPSYRGAKPASGEENEKPGNQKKPDYQPDV